MKIVIIYTFSFLVLLISGCSNYKTPNVYRIDIQQGNDITQEMISQLKQNMSKSQVAYVMGTPLIIDTFNPDRWDYLYSFRPGNGLREQRNITIYFKQDKLDRLTGDTRIATSDELTPALRIDSNVIVPLSDKKIGFFNDLKQTIGIEERSIESTSQKKHDLFKNKPIPVPKKSTGLIDRIIDAIGAPVIQTTTQKVDATKPSLLRRFISLGKDENDAEIKEPLGTVTTN
jgi:outer membrane protein assembly factor BamE